MKINARTEIYGLLGYPVHHTFSPVMHNSAFEDLGINAIYLPFEIKSEDLESSVECLKSIGVKGLNVTIPHKERVIKYLDSLDREAALIGAVNTIVNIKGKYKGYNTDGRGFISSIEEEFGIVPKGKKFFIIGAGGAARAVSFSLALRGACRIVLVDRVGKKAIKLAKSLSENTGCEAIAADQDSSGIASLILDSDVLINASPCGMKNGDKVQPETKSVKKGMFVYDLIYNPPMTKFLKAAKERGAKVSNGMGMLLNQGAISFSLWTGKKAPVNVMRRALKRALGDL